jgi:threonine dehydratase
MSEPIEPGPQARPPPRPPPAVGREGIAGTEPLIRPYIRRTPVIEVDAADLGLEEGVRLVLKLEHLQHTGSFKPRGAFAHLLTREIPEAGVVAASGGNHGVAVAYAAMRRKVPAAIFVPRVASPTKLEQIRASGARLVVVGERFQDAYVESQREAAATGAVQIHPFDHPQTLLGQGTVGMELEAQAPELDSLLVAVGGGGLIAGVAAWYAGAPGRRPRVVGVEPETAPTLTRALEAGRPVDAEAGGIAADSLAPKQVGQLVFPIAQRHVDRVLLVPDEAIRRAQEALWRALKLVAEPGGATALAALLAGQYRPAAGERVGVLVCGGNTTAVRFDR